MRVTELHVSAISAMIGIQETTILNHLRQIHDFPGEGRTVLIRIDRKIDDLVHSKGRRGETANHTRTGAVQGVVGNGGRVIVIGEVVSKPSILRGTISRGPTIAILIIESDKQASI